MKVGDYLNKMKQRIITCRAEDTVTTAATLLSSNRIGAMPVRGDKGDLIGIISERDLVRALSHTAEQIAAMRVQDLMSSRVVTCTPDDTMAKACQLMNQHNFRHLPVVQDGRIVGVVSIRDGLAYRLEQSELEKNILRDNVIAARHR
jgi:CBS domain-containing protein